VMGSTSVKAAVPTAGTRTVSISSVPYADEEIMSQLRTPIAMGFDSRSDSMASLTSGGPRILRFRR
jgi:hypothetical protein